MAPNTEPFTQETQGQTGLTVAEGPSVVLAALEAGVELRAVVFTEEFAGSEKASVLRQAMEDHGRFGRLFVVPKELIARCPIPRLPRSPGFVEFPFRFTRGEPKPTWAQDLDIVAVDIQDPGNVGTLIRTGGFAGATRVILWPKRRSRQSHKGVSRCNFQHPRDLPGGLHRLAQPNARLRATHIQGNPRDGIMPWEADLGAPCALVLGNEARG